MAFSLFRLFSAQSYYAARNSLPNIHSMDRNAAMDRVQ